LNHLEFSDFFIDQVHQSSFCLFYSSSLQEQGLKIFALQQHQPMVKRCYYLLFTSIDHYHLKMDASLIEVKS